MKMAAVITFMESPLVTWVRTFRDQKDLVDFQEICDGVFLNDVLVEIDHRDLDIDRDIKRAAKDTNAKIQNWAVLMRNIHSFYQDVLQQVVVMETPDIVNVVKEPMKESSLSALKSVLLLLLGCAVQCDDKERHINVIKTLDVLVQQELVASIQEVTDSSDYVLDMDTIVGEKELFRTLRNMVDERNSLAQRVLPLTQECDYYRQELSDKRGGTLGGTLSGTPGGTLGGTLTPPVHLEKYQLCRELADLKQRCTRLTEDVEEKSKVISDQQEDLNEMRDQLQKFKSENMGLSRDAKVVQSYRDELDALREQALKVDRCEKDISRYKERLGELDFYKARVEELRRDNDTLSESRSHLEEQLAASERRVEGAMDEVTRATHRVEHANKEKASLTARLQQLMDENSVLEFEKSKLSEGYGAMRRFTSVTSVDIGGNQHGMGHSISDELQDSLSSQMTRLECERDEMKHELDDAKHRLCEAQLMLNKVQSETEAEIQRKVAELQHQTKRAQNQTSKQMSDEYQQKMGELRSKNVEIKRKMSEQYEGRVHHLEQERKEVMDRCDDLEKQLVYVQKSWREDKDRMLRLDRSNRQLVQETEQFKEKIHIVQQSSSRRIHELEQEVETARTKSKALHDSSLRISDLCDDSKENSFAEIDPDATLRSRRLNGHVSTPKRVVNQGCQTSPSAARISYTEDKLNTSHDENQNKKTKHKFLDILRPKSSSSRQGSPLPNRPATVLGVVHENRSCTSTPIKGIVTPQRRSVPSTPEFKEPFKRNDRLRSTIGGGSHHQFHGSRSSSSNSSSQHHPRPSPSDYVPFSRGDRLRSTMPEKRTGYVAPEMRPQLSSSGSRSSISSVESCSRNRSSADLDGSILSYMERAQCPPELLRASVSSDRDSGCPTSPDSPTSAPSTPTKDSHRLTSFQIMSTETIKTQFRTSLPKMGEKWHTLVDKVVELQDKNQKLLGDNSELRKTVNTIKFSSERIDLLEKRNLDLEMENRKLSKIVESLQSTLSGLSQYDKRTYHFYSNV